MSNRISIAKHPYPLISGTISLLIGKEKHLFCFYQSWHCLRMPQSSMEVAVYIIAYKNGKTTCSFVQLLCDDKGRSMMGTQWSTRDWTTQCMNFARVFRVFRSILKKSCHMYSTRWPEAIALVSKSNLQKIVDSMVSLVHAQCHLLGAITNEWGLLLWAHFITIVSLGLLSDYNTVLLHTSIAHLPANRSSFWINKSYITMWSSKWVFSEIYTQHAWKWMLHTCFHSNMWVCQNLCLQRKQA